ncbi:MULTISPECIES: DUF481 domain-containing protein [unclassified Shewanella]|uniref:DUF481 domain-containing protein n=1 Tax=unclassified Shewanella TaxID=196818 RepID=UPI001BC2C386|nr:MULTISPECIES: DUF481 domain-containing protein [unclassified Shewanella]GIU08667.1 hypothetical protein TUM4444_10110 [Shewanella sp. MBTL60-112-B1]GIU39817.1 hypothetical protein TUM4445_37400 [Shewanella sp. MBTL60-112-B2]
MEYHMRYTLIAASCLAAVYSGSALSAEDITTTPVTPQQSVTPADLYPPVDVKYDWLQLTSLELLKGEIKNLYDDKLEFESDELDTVYIDWEDVKVLQSSRLVSIGFTDLTTKTGRLLVENGKSYINGEEFDNSQIMTIIAGDQSEANYWSSKITLGANFRSGNTDQIDYSALAKTIRRTTESRFNLDYIGNYSKTDGENRINNHRINTNFDWFISKQFYLRPVFAEVYKDPFSNIAYRATLGSGLGYNIIDNSKTEWSISGGPAYTYTRFDEVAEGEKTDDGSAAMVIETVYDTEITSDIDFNTLYRIQYGNDKSGGYTHHAIATLEIELTSMFDLDLSVVWDRINNPQPDSSGFMPKQDDYQFIVGFGIDL